jgi:mannosyltransferase
LRLQRLSRGWGYLAIFAIAVGLQTYRITVPSLWWDEAATKASFVNGWAGIDAITLHLDVVHKLFYQLMFLNTQVFGLNTLSLRLPGAIATSLACVLLVKLANELGLSKVGAYFAGLFLAILPRVTWASLESRSYAFDILTGVLTALILVLAVKHSASRLSWLRWLGYAAAMTFATYLYMYQVLLLLAHAIYLWARRSPRKTWLFWGAAAAVVSALAIPLVLTAKSQQQQVAWIQFNPLQAPGLFVSQSYPHDRVTPWIVWAILLGFAIYNWRRRTAHPSQASWLASAWLFAPTLLLMLVSVVATPIYNSRYLSFTAGGFALLVASVIFKNQRRWWVAVLILALLVSLTGHEYFKQRRPQSFGADWAQAANSLTHSARRGDAVIFTDSRRYPVRRVSVMAAAYPEAFKNLSDVTARPNPNHLFGDRVLWSGLGSELGGYKAVWVIEDHRIDAGELARAKRFLAGLGFHLETTQTLRYTSLYRYVKN